MSPCQLMTVFGFGSFTSIAPKPLSSTDPALSLISPVLTTRLDVPSPLPFHPVIFQRVVETYRIGAVLGKGFPGCVEGEVGLAAVCSSFIFPTQHPRVSSPVCGHGHFRSWFLASHSALVSLLPRSCLIRYGFFFLGLQSPIPP